jgi:CheY-like chemotaxis protein
MCTTGRDRHILAGDDSPTILELFREILEDEGYRVTLSNRALDVERVKEVSPDLVILDHMLDDGDGSGWQLLRDLKRDAATANLPVIVCTGAVQRVRAGADFLREVGAGVVIKPFDIEDLLRAVDAAWTGEAMPSEATAKAC